MFEEMFEKGGHAPEMHCIHINPHSFSRCTPLHWVTAGLPPNLGACQFYDFSESSTPLSLLSVYTVAQGEDTKSQVNSIKWCLYRGLMEVDSYIQGLKIEFDVHDDTFGACECISISF